MAPGVIVFVRHAERSDHQAAGRIAVLQDDPHSANTPDPASVHQHHVEAQTGGLGRMLELIDAGRRAEGSLPEIVSASGHADRHFAVTVTLAVTGLPSMMSGVWLSLASRMPMTCVPVGDWQ